jgi:aldehyde:ferredoxin oxidoreductase
MRGGYMGRLLWVDLSTGSIREEVPPEALLRDFVGGYGISARLLYDRIPARADPLGPDNVFGFTTGPLTGTAMPTSTRWTVVGKSPLTDGWGDANGSGFFAVALKSAGYDAVFFTGVAARPVYLYLDDGKAELRDATALWGRDCYEIEDWVKAELGKDVEAACIGPAGEKLSRISGVVHCKGRIAARSGLGAVMGSKRLKLVAARGSQKVPVADPAAAKALNRKCVGDIRSGVGFAESYSTTGTPGYISTGAVNGDSPVRNWGASPSAFSGAENLEFEELLKVRVKREACWRCPIACWGTTRLEYAGRTYEAHQAEYESGAAFGTMALNNDYPSIIVANELCNQYGLDTISVGGCVAFAIECYEAGLIRSQDTGGLELTWGNHQAMNALVEKIARREDIGDLLAEGVKRAAEQLGPAAAPFAIHVGGQELPMHDPRFEPALAVIYRLDATPGRHTQACQFLAPPGYESKRPGFGVDRDKQAGRGRWIKEALCLHHVSAASGACLFGYLSMRHTAIPEFMTAVTGHPFTIDDMFVVGERIAKMRQAFNVRDGINPLAWPMPARACGLPPLSDGPTAGITVQVEQMSREFLEDMGWSQDAAVPLPETLKRLGLEDVLLSLKGE